MQGRAVSYEELVAGYQFPPAKYKLDMNLVSRYQQAVDGVTSEFVPPLAMTACALAALAKWLIPPPGTMAIHASQELEFFKLVPVGAVVECHARVAKKIDRGKMSMIFLELDLFDQSKERVQSGKTTIALSFWRDA